MSEINFEPYSDDILRDAPPLEYDDFEGIHLHANDILMIDEFEQLWNEHLKANPNTIPTGKKGARIQSLQEKVKALQLSKQKVQSELHRQLDFFDTSRDVMADNFERAKANAIKDQEKKLEDMGEKLEGVGAAWRNTEANSMWDMFFDALQDAVEQSEVQQLPGEGLLTMLGHASQSTPITKRNIMKPSAHAMFLNNAAEESGALVKSRDFLLRAYRIDNALLQAHVKVLQRDIEKHECTVVANEVVGKFLVDHNVFGLLASTNPSQSAARSISGPTVLSKPSITPADE